MWSCLSPACISPVRGCRDGEHAEMGWPASCLSLAIPYVSILSLTFVQLVVLQSLDSQHIFPRGFFWSQLPWRSWNASTIGKSVPTGGSQGRQGQSHGRNLLTSHIQSLVKLVSTPVLGSRPGLEWGFLPIGQLWTIGLLQKSLWTQGLGTCGCLCGLFTKDTLSSVQFSCSVVSDSLWPHGLQHARLPCPSPTPGAYSNSCPLSQWSHPAISSSVIPFSFCSQPCPESGSFQMSPFFPSGGQSIRVSASASALPMNIQDWFPLGWTGWISLQSKGLSSLLQHHSSKA